MNKTIEPLGDSFAVYQHSTYDNSSVLAGQDRRTWLDTFNTIKEAQEEHPEAEVLEHSTKVHRGGSLGDMSGLPDCPPSDFDPGYAGENWHEDDY